MKRTLVNYDIVVCPPSWVSISSQPISRINASKAEQDENYHRNNTQAPFLPNSLYVSGLCLCMCLEMAL